MMEAIAALQPFTVAQSAAMHLADEVSYDVSGTSALNWQST